MHFAEHMCRALARCIRAVSRILCTWATLAFARCCRSIITALAFSADIGVASAGFGIASIFLHACARSVTRGVASGVPTSGPAGRGARERASGSIIDSPHFHLNSKSNSLICADQRCSLLLCWSIP